jgi:dTDP-4-dehydrorhamnose reductase
MSVILITGAAGQLGNELKIASGNFYGYDFIFTDIDVLDLTNFKQTEDFIKSKNPDWIVNCSAYNFVDQAESEPDKAMSVNGNAVKHIVDSINGSECRLIHFSTDYVYDGLSNIPYDENSIPNPISAYGRSKLAGEKYALQYYASMVIRTSWLYSSFGNNFVKTILRHAKEKGSLKVVFDQTGTPTYAADLAGAVMSIISGVIRNHFAFNAGVYNYSNDGVCSWYDFAVEIVNEAGLACRVDPILTRDYKCSAGRPVYSVMNKSKIKETYGLSVPHWRDGLKRCMKLLK